MASGEISVPSAMENILNMINAITDQGEGVAKWIRQMRGLLQYAPVKGQFQPDEKALDFDYPNYTDTGVQNNPSGNKVARTQNGALDHEDRFKAINDLLKAGGVVTWDQWHAAGNKWTAEMLITNEEDYKANKWNLPPADMPWPPRSTTSRRTTSMRTITRPSAKRRPAPSPASRGCFAAWTAETTAFPSPSMYGSGDRVSICWAVFGRLPDITAGIAAKTAEVVSRLPGSRTERHAQQHVRARRSLPFLPRLEHLQGRGRLRLRPGGGRARSAAPELLDHLNPTRPLQGAAVPAKPVYSAPSDNMCASFGGCAVPISASQLYPIPDSSPRRGGRVDGALRLRRRDIRAGTD